MKAAISTIERAIAYTQPLRRRTEGVTWALFGLASATFAFSYVWIWKNGYDPQYRLILVWLVGYTLVGVGPAMLSWRIASVMDEAYSVDSRRLVASIVVAGIALIGIDLALWSFFGETPLSIALNIVLLPSAVWAALGLLQWGRLSQAGRRDTWILAGVMALVGFSLVFLLGANAATVDLDVAIFAAASGAIPFLAGVWRLARG